MTAPRVVPVPDIAELLAELGRLISIIDTTTEELQEVAATIKRHPLYEDVWNWL